MGRSGLPNESDPSTRGSLARRVARFAAISRCGGLTGSSRRPPESGCHSLPRSRGTSGCGEFFLGSGCQGAGGGASCRQLGGLQLRNTGGRHETVTLSMTQLPICINPRQLQINTPILKVKATIPFQAIAHIVNILNHASAFAPLNPSTRL